MKMNIARDGAKLTVTIQGRIDTVTTMEIEKKLKETSLDGIRLTVMDFAGVEYITSMGLRMVLAFYNRMHEHGALKIIHVNDDVLQVFDITGFIDLLDIEPDDEAE